ncbi:MAG: hypothetical protein ACR2M7_06025 [Bdellovibrionales bacterium]
MSKDKKQVAQQLYKDLKQAYNDLHELYDFCYKDESNDVWDAEHDALLYECEGVYEEINNFVEEFTAEDYNVEGWNDGWEKEIKDINRANKNLEDYKLATILVANHKPTYTYC